MSEFDQAIALIFVAVALLIMGQAITKSNELMTILKGSKAENMWRQSRRGIILLTVFFVIIMLTRVINTFGIGGKTLEELIFHDIIMNFTFLITAILIVRLVNLDIQAFSSLFDLLNDSE